MPAERQAAKIARPPRAMVWVLLLASAAAIALIGLVATALVIANTGAWTPPPGSFWLRFGGACLLTVFSLSLRTLRWIFLLRRAETRIPLRDAYIGYLAGFSLLVTPFLLGEIAVRASVHRRRGRVPVLTTGVVNLWERGLDMTALALLTALTAVLLGRTSRWTYVAAGAAAVTFVPLVRRAVLGLVIGVLQPVARVFDASPVPRYDRLAGHQAWIIGLATSVAAWALPAVGLWLLAGVWSPALSVTGAEHAYAISSLSGGLMLAPAGVLVAGQQWLQTMIAGGATTGDAALVVLSARLATVGVSMALGVVFLVIHLRTRAAASDSHFDDIADAYDVQIPESRRLALLERKSALMEEVIAMHGIGRRGLDVGCGQGMYVAELRRRGFDVSGIDASEGQIRFAARKLGGDGIVRVGSAFEIPAPDASFDFAYTINVLHHLSSVDEQRRAFAEVMRVLKPGGLLFVHEINTRNVLFRFYMGYVFPSLNCIDEGIERWLLPHRMDVYTDARTVDVRYFTFLPEFVPGWLARTLRPIEAMLERSSWRIYSGHYMCVLQKRR